MLRMQLAQGVGRERSARSLHLDVRDFEALVRRGGKSRHLQPMPGLGRCRRPVRRPPGGDENDPVELRAVHRRARRGQMPDVYGIEGAAKHAEALIAAAHGWYSNSMPAIRTGPPGWIPAASNASLTPSLSSSVWKRSSEPSESRLVRSTRCSTRSPITSKPQFLRSTTRFAGVRAGRLIAADRAGELRSGARASADTIASISSDRPSPLKAET